MGIIARFRDIMAANINALLDKAEDPEKMIDQLMRDLVDDLADVKKETAGIIAEEKRAEREMQECSKEVADLNTYAMKAVQAGNDDDARKFLAEKATLSNKLTGLTEAYQLAHQNADNMRAMHDKLVQDIQELESRKEMIKGKMAVAKTQKKINEMTGSAISSANDSIAAFERMEAKANKMLDEAEAMAELNKGADSKIEDLKSKYASSNSSIEAELAALKAGLTQ
ncbi:MAG: PspA/IM30 family protein [Lachnospiraceae bacterium]|nr:PspA/IM30 family protein [Lachnospiraceae bacterium]MBP3610446.1 PspA/IM30 family protein [Lachnospiraceae bacterium]